MSRTRRLTEGSITAGLLNLSVPILLMSVLQSLNESANSIWVGHYLGEAALTATANANLLLFLIIGVSFGIAMAATILVGQRVGANDTPGARSVVVAAGTLFVSTSVLIGVLGLTFSPSILHAMNTPEPSLPLAIPYMRVIFLALPPIYMYSFVVSVLCAVGDSRTPFWFMLLSIALDVSLNPVFIFGLGPAPRLGIAGSALATLIAQTISLIAMVIHLYRRNHLLCLRYEDFRLLKIDRSLATFLVRKGIPMSGQILVVSLSSVLMITIVNRLGVDTTAAFGAAVQLWNYVQMPAVAVGQGVSAMAAQNVGAKKWERINRITAVGVLLSLILTGVVLVATEAMGTRAFAPFLPPHSAALTLAAHLNSIVASSFLLYAVLAVLFAVVGAAGAVVVPLAIITASLLIVRYAIADVLFGDFGADAIWWSFPVSTALAAVLAALHYKLGDWRCTAPRLQDLREPSTALATPAGRSSERVTDSRRTTDI